MAIGHETHWEESSLGLGVVDTRRRWTDPSPGPGPPRSRALTCPLHGDEQRGLRLLAGLLVGGQHEVLELSTLGLLQEFRVVNKHGPRGVLRRGDHSQGAAVGAGGLQLVFDLDATQLSAVLHTQLANLGTQRIISY